MRNRQRWLVAWDYPILDEDADEELLALLERDSDPGDYPERRYYTGRDNDPPLTPEERERNRRLRVVELAEYAAQQERWVAEYAAQQARWKEQRAAAEVEFKRQVADQRLAWETMLVDAVERVRNTPHAARMLPDLERDLATLRSFPPGPIPWMLNAERFEAEFQRRLRAV
jgi:hypothetical protein